MPGDWVHKEKASHNIPTDPLQPNFPSAILFSLKEAIAFDKGK